MSEELGFVVIGLQQRAVNVSYYPGERDNEDHQTNTHNYKNNIDNNIIDNIDNNGRRLEYIKKTVLLLHYSTCQPLIH